MIVPTLLLAAWQAPEVRPEAWPEARPESWPELRAEPWPEAERLFHQDPRWLGADAAFSVPLGGERVLWLFGDTFVATSAAHRRSQSVMVRNTVGLQAGLDPLTATMSFHWRGTASAPSSFFPEEGERWFWPQHGIRLGPSLLLFLTRLRATPGVGLGFAPDGWRVAVIDDAAADPAAWRPRLLEMPEAPSGLVLGAALVELGAHVVTLAFREPGDHAGFLLRWRRADLVGDDGAGRITAAALARAEAWTAAGWRALAEGVAPAVVLADAGPESSLHHDAALDRWVHVRSLGFGATTIGLALAPRLEGPWPEAVPVYRPPESERAQAFVYAAKAHPELRAEGLVLTYAANTFGDFATLVEDETLYWPRFVRLRLGLRLGEGPR